MRLRKTRPSVNYATMHLSPFLCDVHTLFVVLPLASVHLALTRSSVQFTHFLAYEVIIQTNTQVKKILFENSPKPAQSLQVKL